MVLFRECDCGPVGMGRGVGVVGRLGMFVMRVGRMVGMAWG